jgi:CubicO group peptidase (beta-lactamase class C family)
MNNLDDRLEKIVAKSKATGSSDLIIMKNGKVLVDITKSERRPIYLASVGKPLAGLSMGRAVTLGFIESCSDPVSRYLPEWRQGSKADITIEHIMAHRSGLQNVEDASVELEGSANIVQLAIAAEIVEPPGLYYRYNNKAVALLEPILRSATGRSFDKFTEEEVLMPMGIVDFDWVRDSVGQVVCYGGFVLKANDLVKVASLLLTDGFHNNVKILSHDWISKSMSPVSPGFPGVGYLWYCLSADSGNSKSEIIDSHFDHSTGSIGGCEPLGVYHAGYRGNYIVVLPAARVMAVRLMSVQDYENIGASLYPMFINEVIQWAYPSCGDSLNLIL